MANRDIIVIGASSGGFTALRELVGGLPEDLAASIFIVWHMPPDVRGLLPQVLERDGKLPAANAVDGEEIKPGRIYVAQPDHHLLLEKGRVRVTRGPKENRFRPAVDPLFRSAAHSYGSRVIGVILSGALDDGTSGLWTVKYLGGVAVAQDPDDAEMPSMPENAIRDVEVDHVVAVREMADLLVRLTSEQVETSEVVMEDEDQLSAEIKIAGEDNAFKSKIMEIGKLTPYACPDCHGVLFELKDGERPRYRCHTGHAFSSDSLLATVTENIEQGLWSAIRGIEESIMLLNHMGEHFSEVKQTSLAMLYFEKAREAEQRVHIIRHAVLNHEHLSADNLRDKAGASGDGSGRRASVGKE